MQQDLRVAYSHLVWPVSTVSGVTAQTFSGVFSAEPVSDSMFADQLSCSAKFDCAAIKIGAIMTLSQMKMVKNYLLGKTGVPVVIDPVFAPSSGDPFYSGAMRNYFIKELMPLATLVTPNIEELRLIINIESLITLQMAEYLIETYCGKPLFYIKGGHDCNDDNSITEYIAGSELITITKERWNIAYRHGTGCAMAAAAAIYMAKKTNPYQAAVQASEYVTKLYSDLNEELSFG
jgi:hydroxymethylpyrimidine/phosphomethylpyrimidine kinase